MSVIVLAVGLIAATAGVSAAKPAKVAPGFKTALTSQSIPLGGTVTDTATVTGKAAKGSPTGTVTFSACGPTSTAVACTQGNVFFTSTVGLTKKPNHKSTASVTVQPGQSGWYCFLDTYSGDSKYQSATDNDTSTECFVVTGGGSGQSTPTLTTNTSPKSIPFGNTAHDAATVTGNSTFGAPTGTVTFAACGPTAAATPCTSPNAGSATAQLVSGANNTSTAGATLEPGSPGWYCFLDTYNGDAHYNAVSDNNTSTECVDVTGGGSGQSTPTLTTNTSPKSIPSGNTAQDAATVTGNSTFGAPTGSVTFSACGPTASATPCSSPNAGSATVSLTMGANNKSTAAVTLEPGSPGWYCFLDTYNGDSNYKAVSDNDTSTECVDVTSGGSGMTTPSLVTAVSPKTIAFGSSADDIATVTGNSTFGSPTGSVTFSACGPTTSAAPCTSPNISPVAVGLSAESGNRSEAGVQINPGAPGWYCFLDQYNGDSHYSVVTDNDTSTECLHVTSSGAGANQPASATALKATPATKNGPARRTQAPALSYTGSKVVANG